MSKLRRLHRVAQFLLPFWAIYWTAKYNKYLSNVVFFALNRRCYNIQQWELQQKRHVSLVHSVNVCLKRHLSLYIEALCGCQRYLVSQYLFFIARTRPAVFRSMQVFLLRHEFISCWFSAILCQNFMRKNLLIYTQHQARHTELRFGNIKWRSLAVENSLWTVLLGPFCLKRRFGRLFDMVTSWLFVHSIPALRHVLLRPESVNCLGNHDTRSSS